MIRLFAVKLEFVRKVTRKIEEIQSKSKDFSVLDCFNEIDWKLSGLVDIKGLTDFL